MEDKCKQNHLSFLGIILLLTIIISSSAFAFSTETEKWNEDTLLRDGRTIKVNRKLDFTLRYETPFFPLIGHFTSHPDTYSLEFEHPDTHEIIRWKGKPYFKPVLLDIVDGVPYLVVMGRSNKDTENAYGCPELPYIFLKYEKILLFGRWKPIPAEQAPSVIEYVNLFPDWPRLGPLDDRDQKLCREMYGRACEDLSRETVLSKIKNEESFSHNYFQAKIPRKYDDWNYPGKNRYKNERLFGDCRPPIPKEIAVKLPPPKEIQIEMVQINYDPVRVILKEDWGRLTHDKTRSEYSEHCKSSFKQADPSRPWEGKRFTKDITGQIKVPIIQIIYVLEHIQFVSRIIFYIMLIWNYLIR